MERVKRGYNEASFRQAAFELEQVEEMQLAALPPPERAKAHVKQGNVYLNRGFILEAERQFQDAVQSDPNSSSAHAGLAEVRERTGEPDAARQEAQKSITLQPNVSAYLVLGRLNLAANNLTESAADVNDALKLEPSNANARGLAQALESRGQKLP